jgi:hypothetical protein
MRVWTVQPLVVWERLERDRCLAVDPSCYVGGVPEQYLWLAGQLRRRLPGYGGNPPWWAYCGKPDLRWVRHCQPLGAAQVRLELELPAAFVMPCWAWHTVRCRDYLCFDRREAREWKAGLRQAKVSEADWPLPGPWQRRLEASWERLFDPDVPTRHRSRGARFGSVQEAVFEYLRLEQVRRVTRFLGANGRLPGRGRTGGEDEGEEPRTL